MKPKKPNEKEIERLGTGRAPRSAPSGNTAADAADSAAGPPQPATLAGGFRLVLISGNAGDGKTAFIQQVEDEACQQGADVKPYGTGNGTRFELKGRKFQTNYDGSQDEGDKINDDVLIQFFTPFAGADVSAWPGNETRLIAINEGRLIDLLHDVLSWKKFLRSPHMVRS